ncbi:MAG: hypothetical protein PVI44_03995 [Balneolaceae bacterium]|jgi:hypothetical protein
MTINQINSGNFSEKDIKKSEKSRTSDPGVVGSKGKPISRESRADRFTASGSQMNSDFDLAATELHKLRDSSFSSLRGIKKKINEGAYDNEEVHQKIGKLVKKDLSSIEKMLSKMPGSERIESGKKTLSPEYKKYLIENPKVVRKIADKIASDLKKI